MVAQRRGEAAADGDVLQDLQAHPQPRRAQRVGAVDVLRGAELRCTLEQVKALRDQNARLRRDNERFVRLVDSGEWGRGRVEELSEAGRLLRDERKQLEDLIRSIKDEKDGFVKDAELQAREARALKDRLVSGNFVQRNKLNVRGGSAYNSMQRV